jgi:hypothetical protein
MAQRAERKFHVVTLDDEMDTDPAVESLVSFTEVNTGPLDGDMTPRRMSRRNTTVPRTPAFVLLDRLATGYDLKTAMTAAQAINAAARQHLERSSEAMLVETLSDLDRQNMQGKDDGDEDEDDDDDGPGPLQIVAGNNESILPMRRPQNGSVKITAARDVDSTFLRETYCHGVCRVPLASVPDESIMQALSIVTGVGEALIDVSASVIPFIPPDLPGTVLGNSNTFLSEGNESAAVASFTADVVYPVVANMWDGEDAAIVLHGTSPAMRSFGLVVPTRTAALPMPRSNERPTSRPQSRATSRGGSPSQPLEARISPTPASGRKSPPRPPSPKSTLRRSGTATRNVSTGPISCTVPTAPDTCVLRDVLVTLLREGRARATMPGYAVRMWVAAVRCSATSVDPPMEDLFTGVEHGPLSDTNASDAASSPQPSSATPAPAASSGRVSATSAKLEDASGPQPTPKNSSLVPPDVAPSHPAASFRVQKPSSANGKAGSGSKDAPAPKPEVVPASNGYAALMIAPVRLYAVQTRRDVDVVCRRIAKAVTSTHHIHVTVTLRQECPTLRIPTRTATLRIFLFSPLADEQSAMVKKGPFTRDEMLHAIEKLVRHKPYELGTEPPLLTRKRLRPCTRASPQARSLLDVMASSVNHAKVCHVLGILCCPKRSVGAFMPHISNASAYPLTTTMTTLCEGVEEVLDEFLEDELVLKNHVKALREEVSALSERELRRQSSISTATRQNEAALNNSLFRSIRNTPTHDDCRSGDALRDPDAEDTDPAALHIAGIGENAMSWDGTLSRKPPAPSSPGRNPSRGGSPVNPRGAFAMSTTPRLAGRVTVRTPNALHSGRGRGDGPASTTPSAQTGGIISRQALSSRGVDEAELEAEKVSGSMDTSDKKRSKERHLAFTERAAARERVATLREKVAAAKDELERRRFSHVHDSAQREALHKRELNQFDSETLAASLQRRGADLGFETVDPSIIRNEAMQAKAVRTADRVKAEAFASVDTCSKKLDAKATEELYAAIRDVVQAYNDIIDLTGNKPTTHVGDFLQRHVDSDNTITLSPSPRFVSLKENRRALLLRAELGFLYHRVVQVYKSLSPDIAGRWNRGDYHDPETRRASSRLDLNFTPLAALSAALGTAHTVTNTVYVQADAGFSTRARAAALARYVNSVQAPDAVVAMSAPRKQSDFAVTLVERSKRHIADPLLITFMNGADVLGASTGSVVSQLSVHSSSTPVAVSTTPRQTPVATPHETPTGVKRPTRPVSAAITSSPRSGALSAKVAPGSNTARIRTKDHPTTDSSTARIRTKDHPTTDNSTAASVPTPRPAMRPAQRGEAAPFTPSEYRETRRNARM